MQRWRPYLLSISLHAALIAIIVVLGMDSWRDEPPSQALAIEAVAVDRADFAALARAVRKARVEPPPDPPPDPPVDSPKVLPEPVPPPKPEKTPDATPEPKKPSAAELAAERKADEARRVEDARRAAEARRAEETRRADELRRVEESRRAAALAEEERRRVEDARIRAEREAQLQRDLDAELRAAEEAEAQRAAAARAATLSAQWAAAIQARVQRAWIRPASATAGLDCRVSVKQSPGGTVLSAEVRSCNADETVRQSIEAAVFRASPLPPPPDPSLFERNIELRFRPND